MDGSNASNLSEVEPAGTDQSTNAAFPRAPLHHLLDDAARRFGSRPAIDFLGRHWNWGQIAALADRAAAGLQQIGVAKGVNVGLCLPNTPYFVIMYYAILKAGGTVVNFNPLYTGREIEAQARIADVAIMVSIDVAMVHEKIAALAARGLFKRVIVCELAAALPPLKGLAFRLFKARDIAKIPRQSPYLTYETLLAGAAKPGPAGVDPARHIAALQFTGGTTGAPKAAMLSHANLHANVQQVLASGPQLALGEERILGILPFFHVFAMTAVMNLGVAIGAELILLPRLDMKQLMKTIFARRPTIMPGVPTLYTAIIKAAETAKSSDMRFIRYCISGGAPIAQETAERFEQISGCAVLEGYGLSETSPVVSSTPEGQVRRGSVGRAVAGTIIEIRDPEHPERLLPQGEKGEICIRGPQVMPGYYNQPEETAKAFIDGAFRTGDIGYLDPQGYLFIVDRIKDLILCAGYNVYPRVIEEAAYGHEAVCEAVAIGIPDKYRGQAPKLFVTLREGHSATAEEIKTFLQTHLNKIEMPKIVEIRDSLPKTTVGKLSKKELIAEENAKTG